MDRYDGFSPEDVTLFLTITGEVCAAVAAYQFTNVIQLSRDVAQGRFAAAFPPRRPHRPARGHPPPAPCAARGGRPEALANSASARTQRREATERRATALRPNLGRARRCSVWNAIRIVDIGRSGRIRPCRRRRIQERRRRNPTAVAGAACTRAGSGGPGPATRPPLARPAVDADRREAGHRKAHQGRAPCPPRHRPRRRARVRAWHGTHVSSHTVQETTHHLEKGIV